MFSGITLFSVLAFRPSWFGLIINNDAINYRAFFTSETAVLIAILILLLAFVTCATFLHWLLWRPAMIAQHKRIVDDLKNPFKDIPPDPKVISKESGFKKRLTYQEDWVNRKIQAKSAEVSSTNPDPPLNQQGF